MVAAKINSTREGQGHKTWNKHKVTATYLVNIKIRSVCPLPEHKPYT